MKMTSRVVHIAVAIILEGPYRCMRMPSMS